MIHAAVLLAQARLTILLDHVADVCTTMRATFALATTVVVPSLANCEASCIMSDMSCLAAELSLLALATRITTLVASAVGPKI